MFATIVTGDLGAFKSAPNAMSTGMNLHLERRQMTNGARSDDLAP
jgi:hypothetical protein